MSSLSEEEKRRYLYLKDIVFNAFLSLKKDPSERNYLERFHVWKYWDTFINDGTVFSEGEDIEIYDGKSLAEGKIKCEWGIEFPDWFKEMGNHFGEELENGNILIGMDYSYIDFYYIILNPKTGKKYLETCLVELKFKRETN